MNKISNTPTNKYTNNNMLQNISNVNRIYNVRNSNSYNNLHEKIDKCIDNYDSKKKIVIQNIISNSLNKLTLTPEDVDIIKYIIKVIMTSPDIDVLKISTIYFIIDKLFMYNNGNGLRTDLIEQLKAIENKNIQQYLSIYLKTPGSENNIKIEKLRKCTYIQEREGDSLIFEIVAFTKVNDIKCIVLYGNKDKKSSIKIKSLDIIEDDFKNYNISSPKVNIEKFNINKALKDKIVSGTEIKAPIRKFTEIVNSKNTEVYYIYNKSTGDKYKLYDDKDCKNNYDRKECDNKETSSIVEGAPVIDPSSTSSSASTPSSTLTSSSNSALIKSSTPASNSRSYSPLLSLSTKHRLNKNNASIRTKPSSSTIDKYNNINNESLYPYSS